MLFGNRIRLSSKYKIMFEIFYEHRNNIHSFTPNCLCCEASGFMLAFFWQFMVNGCQG